MAVILVMIILLAAAGVVAWLADLSRRAGPSVQSADSGASLLALIAAGLAVVSLGVVAVSIWVRRRPRRSNGPWTR